TTPAGGAGTALDAAMAQVADEVRRLRAGDGHNQAQRLATLADLGSRLEALLSWATGQVGEPALAPLRSLVSALAGCDGPTPPRGADLDALWQRAVTVLTAFAAGTAPPATGPVPARGAFWKRDRG